MYVSEDKTCISSKAPVYNREAGCLYHAAGSKVLYIPGTKGFECLIEDLKIRYFCFINEYLVISGDYYTPQL